MMGGKGPMMGKGMNPMMGKVALSLSLACRPHLRSPPGHDEPYDG
jgi:hypothetical protein